MKTNLLIALLTILSYEVFASEKEKDSLSVTKNSSSIFVELSAYSGIIKDVASSHKYNANHFATYHLMSKRYYTKKDFKKAIQEFDLRINENRFDDESYFLRGLSKDLIKDYEGAIKDFSYALSLNNKNANLYFHRGFSKMGLKSDIDAKRDFTKAIEISPTYADAYFFRGVVNLRLENKDEARKDLIKAIELGNTEATAYLDNFLK